MASILNTDFLCRHFMNLLVYVIYVMCVCVCVSIFSHIFSHCFRCFIREPYV